MATYDELLRQMQGHIEYFGSPETYARTIKYKEAKGHELSDPASAALFQTMYPALFETSTTPTRSMGVSTDPLYKAIQQIQQPVPVAAPPTPQYQTPEQLAALMQTWMGAMQPYVDIQNL